MVLPNIDLVSSASVVEYDPGDQNAAVNKNISNTGALQRFIAEVRASISSIKAFRDAQQAQNENASAELSLNVDQVNDSIEATEDSLQSVIGNLEETLNSAITTLQNELNSLDSEFSETIDALETLNDESSLNLFPNGGSLLLPENNQTGYNFTETEFDLSTFAEFFLPHNGSSPDDASGTHIFHYNTATYGGDAPALSGSSQAFATACGIDDMGDQARHVPSFAIAQFVTGVVQSGQTFDDTFLFLNTSNFIRLGAKSKTSFSFWYRALAEDAYVRGAAEIQNFKVYIDGVEATNTSGVDGSAFHRLNKNKVYHLAFSYSDETVVTQATAAGIFGKVQSTHQFALPRVASGAFQLLPHRWPVRSTQHKQLPIYVSTTWEKDSDNYVQQMPDPIRSPIGADLTMRHPVEYTRPDDDVGKTTSFYVRGVEGDGTTATWVEVV